MENRTSRSSRKAGISMFLPYVNPLQGTDSIPELSKGNTLPLISLPYAMTMWTPQTGESSWLFHPRMPKLQGVRSTHQPSPWIGDYGHIAMMPQVGTRLLSPGARASIYRRDKAVIKPHYFKAYLGRYDTTMELVPTERCSMMKVTYPTTQQARFIFDPCKGESHVEINPETGVITGFTRGNNGGCPEDYAMYFVCVPSCKPTSFGTFSEGGNKASHQNASLTAERAGAYLEFDTTESREVTFSTATSFISLDQAYANLEREIGATTFESLLKNAEDVWEGLLGRIVIEGATEEQKATFYSCLYRSLLFPRAFHEFDGNGEPIHYNPYGGGLGKGVLYTDNGFWDTFRTVYPLLSIIAPSRLGEIMEGWVQSFRNGGWLPKWASPGYRDCMIGTHLDVVFADAMAKGIKGFDLESAYVAVRRDAADSNGGYGAYGRMGLEDYNRLGYVPSNVHHCVSRTLDYAYDDWGVAQIAKALGKDEDYTRFISRAKNYKNTYDASVGFMRAKNADGNWESFNEFYWGGPYVEGSVWQCGWAVQHDTAGLIELMGGKAKFAAKLDQMLAIPPSFDVGGYGFEIHEMTEMAVVDFGQYAHSNQPVHHVLYLYAACGEPWKTQYWTRRVLTELYGPGVDGFAGDEDNGEMAAWYVLSSMGIFPLTVGHASYVLGSPLFTKMTITLENGKKLTISAPDNSAENVYVQSVKLNGEEWNNLWLPHKALADGGCLEFVMGSEPVTDKTYTATQLPYSLSTQEA